MINVLTTIEIAELYNVIIYPTLYLLDKDKKVVWKRLGYSAQIPRELSWRIEELLDTE